MNFIEVIKNLNSNILAVLIPTTLLIFGLISFFIKRLLNKRDTEKLIESQKTDSLDKELFDAKKDFITVITKTQQDLSDNSLMIGVRQIFTNNRTANTIAYNNFVTVLKRTKGNDAVISFQTIWKKQYPKAQNSKSKIKAKWLLQKIIDS